MESLKKYYNKVTSYINDYSLLCKNQHKNAPENKKIDAEAAIANPADNLPSANKNNYSAIITTTRNLLIFVYLLFVFYCIYTMLIPIKSDFIFEVFVEPCNDTNITSTFDELKNMKMELEKIYYAKNSVKFVAAEYNISKYANEYLAEKYANFTNVYDELKQHFNDQKEIYYKCYKENLLKYSNWQRFCPFLLQCYLNFFVIIANFFFKTKLYHFYKYKLKEFELFGQQLLADYVQLENDGKKLMAEIKQLKVIKSECFQITELQNLNDLKRIAAISSHFNTKTEIFCTKLNQFYLTHKEMKAKSDHNKAEEEKLKSCLEVFAAGRIFMIVYFFFSIIIFVLFWVVPWELSESQIEKFSL